MFCRVRGYARLEQALPKTTKSTLVPIFQSLSLFWLYSNTFCSSAIYGLCLARLSSEQVRESGSIAAVSLWGFPARSPRSGRDLMTYHSEDRYGDGMAKTAADGRAEKWSRDGKGTLKTSPRICSPKA